MNWEEECRTLRQEKREILKIIRSWCKNEHPERATTAMAILEDIRSWRGKMSIALAKEGK